MARHGGGRLATPVPAHRRRVRGRRGMMVLDSDGQLSVFAALVIVLLHRRGRSWIRRARGWASRSPSSRSGSGSRSPMEPVSDYVAVTVLYGGELGRRADAAGAGAPQRRAGRTRGACRAPARGRGARAAPRSGPGSLGSCTTSSPLDQRRSRCRPRRSGSGSGRTRTSGPGAAGGRVHRATGHGRLAGCSACCAPTARVPAGPEAGARPARQLSEPTRAAGSSEVEGDARPSAARDRPRRLSDRPRGGHQRDQACPEPRVNRRGALLSGTAGAHGRGERRACRLGKPNGGGPRADRHAGAGGLYGGRSRPALGPDGGFTVATRLPVRPGEPA